MQDKEKRINLRFGEDMHARILTIAKRSDVSVSAFCKHAVTQAVLANENHYTQMKMNAKGQMLAVQDVLKKFNENPQEYSGIVDLLKPLLSEHQEDWVNK